MDFQLPPNSTMDDRLLSREFYNANNFPVTFTLQKNVEIIEYILANKKSIWPSKIVVLPGEFFVMSHSFYVASWPDGRLADEVVAHFNFGDDMYKGVKPNRETLRKAKRHTG